MDLHGWQIMADQYLEAFVIYIGATYKCSALGYVNALKH